MESQYIFEICAHDKIDELKKYVDDGGDLRVKNQNNSSLLDVAAAYKAILSIKFLIDHGASLQDISKAMIYAAKYNSLECMKILIDYGANINIKDENDQTPLHLAINHNSKECIIFLLQSGGISSLKLKDKYGYTPMQYIKPATKKIVKNFLKEHSKD